MRRFKASVVAWSFLAVNALFIAAYHSLPPDRMLKASHAIALGMVFVVLLRWTKNAFLSLREGRQGYNFLIVGVFATYVILFGQRVWAILLETYKRAPFLTESFIPPYIPFMFAWAAGMVLLAPDTEDGTIASKSYVLLGIAIFIAGVLFGSAITTSVLSS